MDEKEFLNINGILRVRETNNIPSSFSPAGRPMGPCISIIFRPATLEEVEEYKVAAQLKRSHG